MGRFGKIALGLVFAATLLAAAAYGRPPGKADGFRLCMQSFTFNRFTLGEAMDKTRELGVTFIEVFPGHRLGGAFGDQTFDYRMDSAARDAVLRMASDRGLRIVATGVVVPGSRDEWPAIFDFARQMGMEYVTCEPDPADWDLVERLSRKTGVRVAVHNHPQPSRYWAPDSLLRYVGARSKGIGSCADVGHWKREGLDPVQCLRRLDARVLMLHFKDIAAARPEEAEQHDAIWGEGVLDLPGMLRELRRQRFGGYLSIEYENNWENSVPDIKQCIRNFDEIRKEL